MQHERLKRRLLLLHIDISCRYRLHRSQAHENKIAASIKLFFSFRNETVLYDTSQETMNQLLLYYSNMRQLTTRRQAIQVTLSQNNRNMQPQEKIFLMKLRSGRDQGLDHLPCGF